MTAHPRLHTYQSRVIFTDLSMSSPVFILLDIIHIKVTGLLLIGCLGFIVHLLLMEKGKYFLTNLDIFIQIE